MEKHLITENTEPTFSIIENQFNKIRFSNNLSNAKCAKGRFVYFSEQLSLMGCGDCQQIPNTILVDKVKTRIDGKGELIHKITCYGAVSSMQGATNMCEFEGDSKCYIEKSDNNKANENENIKEVKRLVLERVYLDKCTVGRIDLGDGDYVYTLENVHPDRKTNDYISASEGIYKLNIWKRAGRSVSRGYDVFEPILLDYFKDVKNVEESMRILKLDGTRAHKGIFIHTGDKLGNTHGCIIVGGSLINKGDGMFEIEYSDNNFKRMCKFYNESINLDKTVYNIGEFIIKKGDPKWLEAF